MMEDAIRHRTEAQLRAMEKSLKDQEVLTQHYSRQEYVTMNHVFHWLVVEASANKYYEKYLDVYKRQTAGTPVPPPGRSGRPTPPAWGGSSPRR